MSGPVLSCPVLPDPVLPLFLLRILTFHPSVFPSILCLPCRVGVGLDSQTGADDVDDDDVAEADETKAMTCPFV